MTIKFNNTLKIFILLALAFALSSCSETVVKHGKIKYSSSNKLNRKLSSQDRRHKKYQGYYKVGKPYKIKGKTYKPREYRRYVKTGIASWYGKQDGFHGQKTANGDVFNSNTLTAAHPTLPLPSLVRVKNLQNGKSLIVMVNDRGPFAHRRIIDLSEKAAKLLGIKQRGTARVRVEYLRRASDKFLNVLGLQRKNGCKPKRPLPNKRCSVNCEIKKVNLRYK